MSRTGSEGAAPAPKAETSTGQEGSRTGGQGGLETEEAPFPPGASLDFDGEAILSAAEALTATGGYKETRLAGAPVAPTRAVLHREGSRRNSSIPTEEGAERWPRI